MLSHHALPFFPAFRVVLIGDALDVVTSAPKLKEKNDVQNCPDEGNEGYKFHSGNN